jgi:Xaa-Pro aminopeptidase
LNLEQDRRFRVNSRIKNLCAKLEQHNLDGLIVSNPANISYLTKYISRDSYFLVSKKGGVYFTDSRYIEEVKPALKGIAFLQKTDGSVFKLIADASAGLGLGRVGFEERHLPFAEYKKIREGVGKRVTLLPVHGLIEDLRQIKEPLELEKIKKAIAITAKAFKFIENFISTGKREIEIVGELERFIRYAGASKDSFDIIVASGPNSSLPHHIPNQRKIKNNEPVLVDMGVDYLGYKSDLTRVFFLGKIKVQIQAVYDIILNAQAEAIKKIRTDEIIAEIDKASRKYIAEKGFGEFFGHNLGHGVGLETHEEPHISAKESGVLKPGMIFTVEPAIYLPGKFGIRIEDMVLVTHKGCEALSGVP